MPNAEIPEWCDYRDQGGIPIFWARGKFPVVALAFVFGKMNYEAVRLHLYIDGVHVTFHRQQLYSFIVAEHHVLLCDLRVLLSNEEWQRLDARVGHDNGWKRVQVKCETDMIARHWGVYVDKQQTSMDDIQFKCPYPDSSGTQVFFMATNTIMGPMDEEEEEESETTSSHEEDYLLFVRRLRRVLPPHNKVGLTSRAFSRMVDLETYEGTTFWIKETAFSCSLLAFFVFVVAAYVATRRNRWENWSRIHYFAIEPLFFTDFSLALIIRRAVIISMALISYMACASSYLSLLIFLSVLSYPLGLPDVHKLLPRGLKLGFVFLFLSSVCTLLVLSLTSTTIGLEQKKCYDSGADFPSAVFTILLVQFLFYREVRIVVVKRQFLTLTLKELAPATLINDLIKLWRMRNFRKRMPLTEREATLLWALCFCYL